MSAGLSSGRSPKLVSITAVPALFGAVLLASTPASAQIYLGWDFGNGVGIGLGVPPSAYTPCPTYGWGPFYPFGCRYRYAYRPHYAYGYRPYYRSSRLYYGTSRLSHRTHTAHLKHSAQKSWARSDKAAHKDNVF